MSNDNPYRGKPTPKRERVSEVVQIISTHKKAKTVRGGYKRVQAIVKIDGEHVTRHIDIAK